MKRIIFLFILVALGTSNVQAQKLKNYIKKKKEVVERELDRKTDQKLREGVDNLFNKKTDNQNGANNDVSNKKADARTGTTDKLTAIYSFDLNVQYKWMSKDKKGREDISGTFTQMLSNSNYTGLKMTEEGQKVVAIVDEEKELSLVLIESMKSVIVNSTAGEAQETTNKYENKGSTEAEHSTATSTGGTGGTTSSKQAFKKTGKTATIAGYSCDEYTWISEDVEGQVWITNELGGYDLQSTFAKANTKKSVDLPDDAPASGIIMKYIGTDSDGTTTELIATKVSKSKTTFDLSKYKVMKMGE